MSVHVFSIILLPTLITLTIASSECDSPYLFDCGNGECFPTYIRCDGHEACSNGADEICGPNCYKCPSEGSHEKKYHGLNYDCRSGSKYGYVDFCEVGENCVTIVKMTKSGKVKYTSGCMKQKRCTKLEGKNPSGCSENPIRLKSRQKCTFCCNDTAKCNYEIKENIKNQLNN
ncbi:uncharacterized protein LOC144441206 [Glandiceps talaboti]